jgi:hypothetical protein
MVIVNVRSRDYFVACVTMHIFLVFRMKEALIIFPHYTMMRLIPGVMMVEHCREEQKQ